MMDRRMPLVAAMLAVLKCGAAYVPVDPSFPPDRSTHIFAHSQCALLLADEQSFAAALSLGVQLPPSIVLHSDTGAVVSSHGTVQAPLELAPLAVDMEDARCRAERREGGGAMYVLYTSGSTGTPKGVVVRANAVRNTVLWFKDALHTGPHSRVLGLVISPS